MAGESREPGWYPDQNDPQFSRYWNGRSWTARREPVGAFAEPRAAGLALPAGAAATRTSASTPSPAASSTARIPMWMWVIGALLLLRSVAGVVAAFQDPAPGPASTVLPHASAVSTPPAAH